VVYSLLASQHWLRDLRSIQHHLHLYRRAIPARRQSLLRRPQLSLLTCSLSFATVLRVPAGFLFRGRPAKSPRLRLADLPGQQHTHHHLGYPLRIHQRRQLPVGNFLRHFSLAQRHWNLEQRFWRRYFSSRLLRPQSLRVRSRFGDDARRLGRRSSRRRSRAVALRSPTSLFPFQYSFTIRMTFQCSPPFTDPLEERASERDAEAGPSPFESPSLPFCSARSSKDKYLCEVTGDSETELIYGGKDREK
jgi:hypothetical protein